MKAFAGPIQLNSRFQNGQLRRTLPLRLTIIGLHPFALSEVL